MLDAANPTPPAPTRTATTVPVGSHAAVGRLPKTGEPVVPLASAALGTIVVAGAAMAWPPRPCTPHWSVNKKLVCRLGEVPTISLQRHRHSYSVRRTDAAPRSRWALSLFERNGHHAAIASSRYWHARPSLLRHTSDRPLVTDDAALPISEATLC